MSISTWNFTDAELSVVQKLQSFFEDEPEYTFEKVVGAGAFGVTACIRKNNAEPDDYSKIAVKALSSAGNIITKGLIGMAYPPGNLNMRPTGPRDQLPEILPPETSTRSPLMLAHNDLHEGNVMIGDSEGVEHSCFPVVKFIDFGATEMADDAIGDNIREIGCIMCNLLWSGNMVDIIRDKQNDNTLDPNLDLALLNLVTKCIEWDPASQPTISELLSVIGPKTQETYPNIPEESDLNIFQLLQINIFDAAST
ncbi:hypothetical protein F4678DRAFT_460950 [Xylaria arbuscula]|nr:hypothetical protein F4678DRAFT_460950 [Xylaria arbuscula]